MIFILFVSVRAFSDDFLSISALFVTVILFYRKDSFKYCQILLTVVVMNDTPIQNARNSVVIYNAEMQSINFVLLCFTAIIFLKTTVLKINMRVIGFDFKYIMI